MQVTGGQVDPQAVIVSLSTTATTAAKVTSTLPSLDLNKVDDALSWAAGANGFANNAAHFDWKHMAAEYGSVSADHGKAAVDGAAAGSAFHVLSYASSLGIPIQASVSPDAIEHGATPGTISVGAFSFTNGGSTYAVTPGKDGTLVGTKDGQAWKTWQSSSANANAGTTAALQVLTSLHAHKGSIDKASVNLNVSA